ncbi:hypothetical protein HDU76_002337, partial [Blyttiomyces sp. JEL0837]
TSVAVDGAEIPATPTGKRTALVIVIPRDLDDDKYVERTDSGVEMKDKIAQEPCKSGLSVASGSTREGQLGDSVTKSKSNINDVARRVSAPILQKGKVYLVRSNL